MNLEEYKNKKVWAVVGSVHNPDKFAYKIYKFLLASGYKAYPVDPSGKDVDNEKSYKSLLELPEVPEAVDMVINPIKGGQFVDEARQLDIKYMWFQPGAENEDIIEKAKAYGIDTVSNKCVMVEFR